MRIALYVGSFNPPHLGHKKVIDFLLEKDLVDKVLLLPTPSYWDKNDLLDENKRIEMLRFYESNKVKVDNVHNKYKYTYEVIRSIKKDYSQDEIYLVIGSDNLERFHEWKEIDEILENKIIVLKRGKIIKNKYIDDKNIIYRDDFDNIEISSTDIRKGDSEFLDSNILDYIKKNHLYNYEDI